MSSLVTLAADSSASLIDKLLDPNVLPLMIPILGIISGTIIVFVAVIIKHRERLARIQRGMDPSGKDDPA